MKINNENLEWATDVLNGYRESLGLSHYKVYQESGMYTLYDDHGNRPAVGFTKAELYYTMQAMSAQLQEVAECLPEIAAHVERKDREYFCRQLPDGDEKAYYESMVDSDYPWARIVQLWQEGALMDDRGHAARAEAHQVLSR
jgi:hypothetical protein